jgi:hypothetical protein
VKPLFFLIIKKNSDFNRQPFGGGGFLPGWIVNYADFIQFDSSRAGYHMVVGFRLCVHCKLVAVRWMANRRSFCFIIAFHNFATLEKKNGFLINAQVFGRLSLQQRRIQPALEKKI